MRVGTLKSILNTPDSNSIGTLVHFLLFVYLYIVTIYEDSVIFIIYFKFYKFIYIFFIFHHQLEHYSFSTISVIKYPIKKKKKMKNKYNFALKPFSRFRIYLPNIEFYSGSIFSFSIPFFFLFLF